MKNNSLFSILITLVVAFFLLNSCQFKPIKDKKNSINQSTSSVSLLSKKIDSVLFAKLKAEHVPGISVVIVQNGKTIYKQGYGVANTETNEKVDADSTIFRIDSISKALTFITLTKLIDKGLVDYDDAVSKYIDGIKNPYKLKDTVKIKHLLAHTGGFDQIGIGRQIYDFELSLDERKAKRKPITEFLQANNMRRIRPAGQHFTYDTYGATIAGVIIEKVTGLPYAKAMQKELFEPLGMNLSSVEVKKENINKLAKGHGYIDGNYKTMPYEIYVTQPASSIDATSTDIGKLLEALTGNGSNENAILFSPEIMKKVLAPGFRPHSEFIGASHGLFEIRRQGNIPDAYNVRTIGHGGSMLGFIGTMEIIPELNLGFFVIANRNREGGGGSVSLGKPLKNVLLNHFGKEKKTLLYPIPSSNISIDLEEYSGNYTFGLYCHTCSENELNKGGWPRGNLMSILAQEDKLILNEKKYLPREKDIFVSEDGKEMIFFGRNENIKISFLVFSNGLHSFERINE